MQRLSQISKSIKKNQLQNQTIVITGASRGIGLAIAKKCANGANIVIMAKTIIPHPKLPGTIFTAAKQLQSLGAKVLPLECDIRNEQNVKDCIQKTIQKFGGIDILINNASAISLTKSLDTSMKKYDLMHSVNIRGTFMVSKYCLPYLLKSKNPHILNISPPIKLDNKMFGNHLAYSISKIGMSMCTLGMAEQFRQYGISVNSLWPKTSVATATIRNFFGGEQRLKTCKKDTIMGDAAYFILTQNPPKTGQFYIEEQVLKQHGITDLSVYKMDQAAIHSLRP